MQNVKIFLRRVHLAMNKKGFNIPVRNKARIKELLQIEYIQMLEENLLQPVESPKTASQIAREMTAAVPNVGSPGARKPVDAIATTVISDPREEDQS